MARGYRKAIWTNLEQCRFKPGKVEVSGGLLSLKNSDPDNDIIC